MAMKWYKPEDREPAFEHKYPLLNINKGYWTAGYLKEIKTTAEGSKYLWINEQSEDIFDITHYLTIEPPTPKNNQ